MARSNGTSDRGTGTEDIGSIGYDGSTLDAIAAGGTGSTGAGAGGSTGSGGSRRRNRSGGGSGSNASTGTRTKAAEPQPEVILEDSTLQDIPTFRPGKKLSKAEKLAISRAWADRMCYLVSRIGVNVAGSPMDQRGEYERQYIEQMAGMTPQERADIVKPLAEILAETKMVALAGPWANPLSLVLATGAYASHVYMVYLLMHPGAVPFWMRLFNRKGDTQPPAEAAPEGVEMYGAWPSASATAQAEAPGGEVVTGDLSELSATGIDHVLGAMKRE